MTTLTTTRVAPPSVAVESSKPKLWGFDAEQLHDVRWREQGITVVRQGQNTRLTIAEGTCYLLIEPGLAVLFEGPTPAIQLKPNKPGVEILTVVEYEADTYSERVVCDSDDRFLAVRRSYEPQVKRETRIALTTDANVAARWNENEDAQTAWMDLLEARGWKASPKPSRCEGHLFQITHRAEAEQYFLSLMRGNPKGPTVGLATTYAQKLVYVHPKAHVSTRASVIGPVWIGAGRVVVDGDVVIGPCVLDDVIEVDPREHETELMALLGAVSETDASTSRPSKRDRLDRLFNVIFSLMAICLTLPLYPVIAMLIWLEDGRPFLFRHERQTRGGRNFGCLKFRTMCRNADQLKAQLQEENASDGPQFHMPDDPRLLWIGRWLRRFHLDELPQFFNVLVGDMNVVGPRPSPDNENQCCPAWRKARLSVRPGITGLWQICRTRRPHTDFQEWIRYDMLYVRRRSWRLDIWIVYKTFRKIIFRGT